MVTKTPNLKLNKPAGTDLVDISQLNANMDTLDKAIIIENGVATIGRVSLNATSGYVIAQWFQLTGTSDLGSAPPMYPVLRSDGWIYSRTAKEMKADLGVKESVSAQVVNLSKGSWTGSGPFSQTVSATGVTASNDVLVTLASSASASAVGESAIRAVHCTTQGNGTLTFEAESRPTMDIPIVAKVL